MKFLPYLYPTALLGLALSLGACATPANRRELYNTAGANGPWHDYERRMDASEETGVAPGDMGHAAGGPISSGNNTGATSVVRSSKPTPLPKSSPIAPDATALPSTLPAPPPPVPAAGPASPTSTDPAAPAAPGGATTVPPADPATVPVTPPTT